MDVNKWKSMAIKKENHALLKGLCADKYRAPAAMFEKILLDYIEFQAKKRKIDVTKFKNELISKGQDKQI
ncbi:MAG: hypothetical protein O3A55_07775 [Bacteroidetes bacterium]|nr:hypothetical protein [Bacteroidota bacterium]